MVAARLARVTGGGQAFRVGGEEFSIFFRGKSMKEVVPHLDSLRIAIEEAKFRVRSTPERRSNLRDGGRRKEDKKATEARSRGARKPATQPSLDELSVTVSIGVAEPTPKAHEVEQVIQAADKALYRAKKAGRNRVETASETRTRTPRLKRNIA